jgi:hypothetical protein
VKDALEKTQPAIGGAVLPIGRISRKFRIVLMEPPIHHGRCSSEALAFPPL